MKRKDNGQCSRRRRVAFGTPSPPYRKASTLCLFLGPRLLSVVDLTGNRLNIYHQSDYRSNIELVGISLEVASKRQRTA